MFRCLVLPKRTMGSGDKNTPSTVFTHALNATGIKMLPCQGVTQCRYNMQEHCGQKVVLCTLHG